MIADKALQELHLRSARGEPLTADERARLEAWYAEMDRGEAEMLKQFKPADDLDGMRAQSSAILEEVVKVAQNVQAVSAENEKLRREIADLEQRLARKQTGQPA